MQKIWSLVIALLLALAGLFASVTYFEPFRQRPPPDDLVIATGSPDFSALSILAEEKGFFEKNRLNVTLVHYPTGITAVESLAMGKSDLAYAAEFVGVNLLGKYPAIQIIGCTAKCDVISLVARKDRGVLTPDDLSHRSVALPKGTQAEFFLGRFLVLNGIDPISVRVLDRSPADTVHSVVTGESDAGIIWEPYAYDLGQQLGNGSTRFPAQSGQRFFWVVYTRPDQIRNRSDVLGRYFRALREAGIYLSAHEEEAIAIMEQHLDAPPGYTRSLFENNQYQLSLDQSLLIAMEDETRWMISRNLTSATTVPNYLDSISPEVLFREDPHVVRMILEGSPS